MEFSLAALPLPARIRPEKAMTDDEFLAFCRANDLLNIERQSSGEIIVMTPAGGARDRREILVASELLYWAEEDGRGISFGSSAGFILSDRATLSPDAAWVRRELWEALTPQEREKFLPFCPASVVEVISPSDSVRETQDKMQQWIDNGAELGWLFDPYRKTLTIYRAGVTPEVLFEPESIEAAGPAAGPAVGFRLSLKRIWA